MGEQDALFRALVEQSADAVVLYDNDGYITYANGAIERATGYTPGEFVGQKAIALVHPDDKERVQYMLTSLKQSPGKRAVFQFRLRCKNGDWRSIEGTTVNLLLDPAVGNLVGYFRDITERTRAEQERADLLAQLQQAHAATEIARQRLHDLLMQAPAIICLLHGPDCVVELANPSYLQLFGNRDLLGKSIFASQPELAGQGFRQLLNRVYTTGETISGNEMRAVIDRHNNGRLQEAFFNFVYQPTRNEKGEIDGILVHAVEVTEQVRARQEVQRSQQRLELAQQSADIGTFEWDIQSDVIIWTPELEALYGLPPNGFEGKYENWVRRVHPEDRARAEEHVRAAVEGKVPYNIEFRVVWPDGTIRWLLAKGEVYFDQDHKPLRMIGVNIDVTERKEQEKSKDEFISMTSHELRNPLTTIRASLQLARRRLQGLTTADEVEAAASRIDAMLERAERQVAVEDRIVGDLLDVSRIQQNKLELHPKRSNLSEIVREAVADQQAINPERVFKVQIPDAEVMVMADEERIGQVIANYLTNAVKYSPSDKSIEVREEIHDDVVRVSVIDEGPGLSRVEQQRVWERFYQVPSRAANPSQAGLGLGLYICQTIIALHHGQVGVDSYPGRGSTFWFSLPLLR